MGRRWQALGFVVVLGCGGTTSPDGQASPSGPVELSPGPAIPDAGASGRPLGLNDVTILVPPPATASDALLRGSDVTKDGTPLVPRDLFERLALEPMPDFPAPGGPISADVYDALVVTAVRFDLCDRNLPGACAAGADGRIRLVLQQYDGAGGFVDVGFHAFYSVPAAELPALVNEARELAALQNEPVTSPLKVSPALAAGKADYRDMLRSILERRAGSSVLVRLTMNAQPALASQIRWVMRGVEKKDGAFVPAVIPGMTETTQEVITSGKDGFESKPLADTPAGILQALDDQKFAAATDARKRELLAVLVSADNPDATAPDTIACIGCHTATPVLKARTQAMGVDPATIPGRYTSTRDLSVGGKLLERRVIRALGWLQKDPIISQRVVNDSAQVLTEIEARFPPQ